MDVVAASEAEPPARASDTTRSDSPDGVTAPSGRDQRGAGGGPSRMGTVAWVLCSIALIGAVTGIWLRMRSEEAGASVANAIIAGERPAAPALPSATIDGDGAPGLPDWYRAEDGLQTAHTPGATVLVVNMWASWCGPCEQEMPDLVRVAHRYADRGVTVIGLNAAAEDALSDAREFVRRHHVDYGIVRASRADIDAWGTTGYPQTFVVGVDGRVSAHVNGPVDRETLTELLDVELAEERS